MLRPTSEPREPALYRQSVAAVYFPAELRRRVGRSVLADSREPVENLRRHLRTSEVGVEFGALRNVSRVNNTLYTRT